MYKKMALINRAICVYDAGYPPAAHPQKCLSHLSHLRHWFRVTMFPPHPSCVPTMVQPSLLIREQSSLCIGYSLSHSMHTIFLRQTVTPLIQYLLLIGFLSTVDITYYVPNSNNIAYFSQSDIILIWNKSFYKTFGYW